MEYIKRGQIGTNFSEELIKNKYQLKFSTSAEKLASLKNSWDKAKVFNWEDFFPENVAKDLHAYYFYKHKDDWDLVIHPDPNYNYENLDSLINEEGYYHMYLTKDDDPTLPERIQYIREVNSKGDFSYMYRRTTDFHPYLNWFSNPKFISIVENLTGFSDLKYLPNYSFVSCYEEGHYNGPHTDGDNGRVAMVYHLSQDWRPYYGGVFMKMDWGDKVINKAISPPFNALTMFNVVGGAPHCVSEVVQGVKNKRIAFTAWYQ